MNILKFQIMLNQIKQSVKNMFCAVLAFIGCFKIFNKSSLAVEVLTPLLLTTCTLHLSHFWKWGNFWGRVDKQPKQMFYVLILMLL